MPPSRLVSLKFRPHPRNLSANYSPKTAPLEISSVTPRPRDGRLIKPPVRNCFRHLLVFPPINEIDGISACSLRSPDHVEARSPPTSRPGSGLLIQYSMGGGIDPLCRGEGDVLALCAADYPLSPAQWIYSRHTVPTGKHGFGAPTLKK